MNLFFDWSRKIIRDLTHVTRVMKQGLCLWHLDDLNSKMEIFFSCDFAWVGKLKMKHFGEFLKFLLKSGNDEIFYFIQSLLQSGPTGQFLTSGNPWLQYSLCFLTIFLFICCLKLIGCSSVVFIPTKARSILIGWPMRTHVSKFWNSKRMRKGSPISVVCTIKLPVSHSMTHYIKD